MINDLNRSLARGAAALIAACGLMVAASGEASAVSERVKQACRGDYFQFCPSYEVGSSALRQCMRAQGKHLSLACRRALAADGEMPAKYAR